jgi:hypothetical protein
MNEEIKDKDLEVEQVKTKKQIYDEQMAIKRAARAKKQAKELRKAQKAELKKKYHNPAYSLGGRILIWILVIAMLAAFFISLGFLIAKNLK